MALFMGRYDSEAVSIYGYDAAIHGNIPVQFSQILLILSNP